MSEEKIKRKCYLQSVDNLHPPIEITEDKLFVGRSRETLIQDTFCSRKQVCLKANLDDQYVLIKPIGINPSALNGFLLEQNKTYEAVNNDILEIIQDKYFHRIIFDPSTLTKNKRKRSDDDQNIPVAQKNPKVDDKKSMISVTTENDWDKIDGGQLYIFTSKGVSSSQQIAAYDCDGTLIKTQSGKVFPVDINDWKIAFNEVPGKLKQLHSNGFKIVIFTNQAGISKGKTTINEFKVKMEKIVAKLNVPIQAFIATGKGKYRKPMIGMWETLCKQQEKDEVEINISKSFYVGDAAGRPELKTVKCKKDHSAADRLMAINIGLSFYTPEEHFMKAKTSDWIKPEFNPHQFTIPTSITDPANAKLDSKTLEVILMVGGPGSGKSYFTKNYLENKGYKLINRDKLGTWQKCVSSLESALKSKTKSVIDNTNPDYESRKRYLDVAKKFKVPVRCFIMGTTYKHSKHNNIFRELTDPTHKPITDIVLNSYKKNYVAPKLKEGYIEIVNINFIPKFRSVEEEKLYKMFLLDS